VIFHLVPNPATFNDPRWQISTVRESVWVMADGPYQARTKVALATLKVQPCLPGEAPLRSPWYDEAFATCVVETARSDVPEKTVIRANGQPVE
jgi:hypothetical protein